MYQIEAKAQFAHPGEKVIKDGDFHTLKTVYIDKGKQRVSYKFYNGDIVQYAYDTVLTFQRPLEHPIHWSEVPAGSMIMHGVVMLKTGQVVPVKPLSTTRKILGQHKDGE